MSIISWAPDAKDPASAQIGNFMLLVKETANRLRELHDLGIEVYVTGALRGDGKPAISTTVRRFYHMKPDQSLDAAKRAAIRECKKKLKKKV